MNDSSLPSNIDKSQENIMHVLTKAIVFLCGQSVADEGKSMNQPLKILFPLETKDIFDICVATTSDGQYGLLTITPFDESVH